MLKIVISFALLLTAVGAQAADGYVSGLGAQSCAEVNTAIQEKALTPQEARHWVQGYFSGANVVHGARSKRGNVNAGSTLLPDRIMQMVMAKCEANQAEAFSKAVNDVYFELVSTDR
jgi:hypothetical protein